MIEIKEVKTKKQLKEFARFPIKLYKDCPYYVPSLRSDELATFNENKNFSLEYSEAKGFLCYKDGVLVGRIAGIISNVDNANTGKKMIRFSRFEAIDDLEVFKALLGAVENYGKEKGMNLIHGPWGFNDQDREGMLTEGFNERSTYATNYYYPYFAENMRKLGYADESKWVEFRFEVPTKVDERLEKIGEMVKNKYKLVDITETMSVKQICKKYGDSLFDCVNEAYGDLDGYVKIDGRMKENTLSQFASIINKKYLSILIDQDNEVAGFAVVLPSICDTLIKNKGKLFPVGFLGILKSIKKANDLEMALIGVRKKYKNGGMNALMISNIAKNVVKSGDVINIESNPMLEHNLSIQQQWKFIGHEIVKRRQTFKKPIEESLIAE